MEGKARAAVLAACLLVLLLSGQPPRASGMAPEFDYDRCYDVCYSHCREVEHKHRWVCRWRCHSRCDRREVAAASELAGDGTTCRDVCLASVGSGTAAATATAGDGPTDADVAACVDCCTGNYGRLNAKRD